MKKILLVLTLAIVLYIPGRAQKETRDVGNFTYVSMGISGDLYLKQGNKTEVVLEGNDEALENIETDVSGNKLRIRTKNWKWYRNYSRVKIYVTLEKFEGASVSGSGNLSSEGQLTGGDIDLSVSGSGELDLDLDVQNISMSISGSGDISLSGNASSGNLRISGSGKLDAIDLLADEYDIRISGSGDARVNVSKSITSNISGSGTVRYKGNPDKVYNHSSGSGTIRKI